ncbi:MAG: hypothetical protein NTW87_01680 [Planctomycetota bacterium]|nr:hypothetical protein [Planctomycetota bacterium]
MNELEAMRALSPETKALVLVSEFELRRMPTFQLRAVLEGLAPDAEERKAVMDMAERRLRESGHPPEQVAAFLTGLLATAPPQPLPG